tara:strand:- start:505 stop:1407 length:903 start_codon:yes stop_codon:yes gene_type:complete
MKKIFIGPASFGEINKSALLDLEKNGFEVIQNNLGRKINKDELIKILSDTNIIASIAGLENYDKEVILSSQLKVISRLGSGMDNIDLQVANENNLPVFTTPNGPINSVAEITLGMIIYLLRNIDQMKIDMKRGIWNRSYGNLLEGKNVLIIGFGKIGRRVYELLRPFNCNILVVDPLAEKSEQYQLIPLNEALAISDIVTFHVNINEEIINYDNVNFMKDNTILLNSSRGMVIREEVIMHAINHKKISAGWLDVFEDEPYSGDLINQPNLILTPHIGSFSVETRLQMEKESVENIVNFFS